MEAFDKLPAEINHLVSSFSSIPVVGDLVSGLTQYTFWLIVSSIVLLIIMFAFAKRVAVVPRGRFANAVEFVIESSRTTWAWAFWARSPGVVTCRSWALCSCSSW